MTVTKVRGNMIANFVGQGWTALMGLVFAPIYLKMLGIEAYGLIGFFTMLQVWLTLLDLGMMPASVREMARYTSGEKSLQQTRELLYSFELICIAIATAIVLVLTSGASFVGTNWLKSNTISPSSIKEAVVIMGFILAMRLPEGLYRSCLVGLQRQIWLNIGLVVSATIRSVGAVLCLVYVNNSVHAFFLWQAVASTLTLAAFGIAVHCSIPKASSPVRFSKPAVVAVGRFAAGMAGINLLAMLLTQVDKLLLSKLLPLENFGYYMLASAVVSVMYSFSGPITQAVFPAMAEDVASGSQDRLTRTFHNAAQLHSAVIAPIGLTLIFLSRPLIFAWTGDVHVAAQVAPIVSLLAVGTLLNIVMHMPYFLQVANGQTRLLFWGNVVAVVVLVPMLIWLVPIWGAVAAAGIWATLNASYLLVIAPLTFHATLHGQARNWMFGDVLRPSVAAALVFGVSVLFPFGQGDRLVSALRTISIGGVMLVAALLTVQGLAIRVWRMFHSVLARHFNFHRATIK